MKTSEQINEIAAALAKAQGFMTNPIKNKTVKMELKSGKILSYAYADLPNIITCIREHLSANGLSHSSSSEVTLEGGFILGVRLMHTSGQWLQSEITLPPSDDPKAFAGNITYFKRYLLTGLIGCAADDDEEEAIEPGNGKVGAALKPSGAPVPIQPKTPIPDAFSNSEVMAKGRERLDRLNKAVATSSLKGSDITNLMKEKFGKSRLGELTDLEFGRLMEEVSPEKDVP